MKEIKNNNVLFIKIWAHKGHPCFKDACGDEISLPVIVV